MSRRVSQYSRGVTLMNLPGVFPCDVWANVKNCSIYNLCIVLLLDVSVLEHLVHCTWCGSTLCT